MKQLSGLDSAFIHQDSRRTPMHVSAALLYDIGTGGEHRVSLNSLREMVAERLHSFPLLRRKLLQVPLKMDTPYWVDAGEPDCEAHVREYSIAPDCSWPDLQAQLAGLHQQRLDLRRPLWEMILFSDGVKIPRLPGRYQVLFFKAHHAVVDGMSLAEVILALHNSGRRRITEVDSVEAPGTWDLWTRVNENALSRQLQLASTLPGLVSGVFKAHQATEPYRDLPPIYRSAALFNDLVSSARSTGALLIPSDTMKAMRRSIKGVTLNDVAVALVSGAMRRYLQFHNCLPDQTLASGVPINLRTAADKNAVGNRIATMVVGMATHEADPLQRLKLIHRYALAGKKRMEALGSRAVMDLSDSVPPNLLVGGILAIGQSTRVANLPVPQHTIISSVIGPLNGLRLGDAPLVVPLGFGPIRDNMGLFHIVSGGGAWFSIAFNGCQRLLPDPRRYEQFLCESLDELERATFN